MKIFFISTVFLFSLFVPQVFGDEKNAEILVDGYKIEKFVTGLNVPVAIDFIGSDIFVLQKNDGNVILIQDDGLHKQSIMASRVYWELLL